MECVRACSKTFFNEEKSCLAFLKIREKEGVGNVSKISGPIIRPSICVQCGKCATVCPVGAIKKNQLGVYIIDIKMCTNCGRCREACPVDVIVEDKAANVSKKCIACGKCVAACPMNVLSIAQKT